MKRKRKGVAAIPNRCSVCNKFKPWAELVTHFAPDTDSSSEDQSWRECLECWDLRPFLEADRKLAADLLALSF